VDREVVNQLLMETLDNQIRLNDPPETKQALDRLVKEGYTTDDAKKMLANCLVIEIFGAIKFQKPFNQKRYLNNLANLPAELK